MASKRTADWLMSAVFAVACAAVWMFDFYPSQSDAQGEKFAAKVVAADNSAVSDVGLVCAASSG